MSKDSLFLVTTLSCCILHLIHSLVTKPSKGALNEAMSDIMAAFIEQANGADDRSTWLLGEDIWEAGEALRSMCDPAAMGDYDYYPTRYVGSADHGGVHSNSGIANLGE